jgi:DNA polymerase/3'-5' exonuclease PolX
MSEQRYPIGRARDVAQGLRLLLEPYCERVEIAGSIRRARPEVKDIELVAIPRVEDAAGTDLWGTPEARDLLADKLLGLSADGLLVPRAVEVHRADGTVETQRRVGQSYQALVCEGIPVDLFIVRPPAEWGVIFAIRTGPGDFGQRLVTDCQRYFRRVEGGRVLHLGQHVPCPEEADFFRALGQPWVEPSERSEGRVAISNPDGAA